MSLRAAARRQPGKLQVRCRTLMRWTRFVGGTYQADRRAWLQSPVSRKLSLCCSPAAHLIMPEPGGGGAPRPKAAGDGGGGGGRHPQACATALPSGAVSVRHQPVAGSIESASSRLVAASTGPWPATSPAGGVWPKQVVTRLG